MARRLHLPRLVARRHDRHASRRRHGQRRKRPPIAGGAVVTAATLAQPPPRRSRAAGSRGTLLFLARGRAVEDDLQRLVREKPAAVAPR
jgi:hypothetical protein